MKWNPAATWGTVAITSVGLWILESWGSPTRFALIVGLSCSSFAIGSAVGFLLSSYGEETATLGKVRDWLIGGITTLTITNVASIRALLLTFAAGPGAQEFALTVGVAITFTALGFFFMFFQRELILNVLLARSRAQRGRVDGTSNAGIVAQRLFSMLPPSLLSGVDDIEELVEERELEAEELRSQLYSDEVSKFLDEAKDAGNSGCALDWDVVSKVAVLHYYRTYFEKGKAKKREERQAEEWIKRALAMNPDHADLKAKYADVLAMMERYEEAVAVIEPLAKSTDGPAYTRQWLGYFLLFVDREEDAIRLSYKYAEQFPYLDHAYINMACGYAQLHGKGVHELPQAIEEGPHANKKDTRAMALDWMRKGLEIDPDYAEDIKEKLTLPGESFESLAEDSEFRTQIAVGLIKAAEKHSGEYRGEISAHASRKNPNSTSRMRALKLLKDALELDPVGTKTAMQRMKPGQSFASLADDDDFKRLLNAQEGNRENQNDLE